MTPIRIGQIGVCHEHAAGKLQSLRRLPELFEIVGVVDDRASTAPRFAGADLTPYAGLTFMSEAELFRLPGLQAVTVETANGDLVPTALRCLEHGLPMHMDKPGGEDLALFTRLRRGCEERRLPFQMGYMFRGNPAIRFAQRAVRAGWLGEIFAIQASMSHNYGGAAYQTYLGQLRGGIIFNLACHLIDSIVPMLGRPLRVVPFLKSAPGYPDTITNNGLVIMEYPHATVTLRACSLEVDGQPQRNLRLCGTQGTIDLCPLERFDGKPLQLRLVLRAGNAEYAAGTHTVDFGVQHDRYTDQLRELAQMVRGEIENPYDAAHDCLVQELLLASSAASTSCSPARAGPRPGSAAATSPSTNCRSRSLTGVSMSTSKAPCTSATPCSAP